MNVKKIILICIIICFVVPCILFILFMIGQVWSVYNFRKNGYKLKGDFVKIANSTWIAEFNKLAHEQQISEVYHDKMMYEMSTFCLHLSYMRIAIYVCAIIYCFTNIIFH